MNKHLLLAIFVLSTSILAKSQTNVSGNITGNTTWTKASSPYILTGNVGVRTGYILTIEPGVTIERNGDYQILINGAVQINGTQEDSIQFVTDMNIPPSSNIFPFPTDSKYFIEFQKSDLNSSSVSYISFQQSNYTANHIRIGNESQYSETNPKNSGTLRMTHSNLSNGYITTNGYQTQAHLSIDSCLMNNGVIYSYSARTEDINISNSQIVNSAVWSNSYANGISFTNCYLGNSKLNLMSSVVILNSTFENNYGDSFGSDNTIKIKNSNFINTYFNFPFTDFNITDSKFTVNNKLTDPYGNEIPYLLTVNQISTRNTRFVNNSSYSISGINVTGRFSAILQNDVIIHNQFANFYDIVSVNDFGTIQLDSNYFSISGRYDIVNNTTKDFSALHNYFQLKNGQKIDDVIFDQNDDLAFGLVTYTPYESDPVVLPVTTSHINCTATEQVVKLSWQVNKETNIVKYVVERKTDNGFISIGLIAANRNNIDGVSDYSYTDSFAVSGIDYYRLKIVDMDGKCTYSDIVPVTVTGKNTRIALYPNPASTYVVEEHKAVNTTTKLMLVDMQGRKLKTIVVAKRSTQTRVDLGGIAKGVYKIIWQEEGKTKESETLLVQ